MQFLGLWRLEAPASSHLVCNALHVRSPRVDQPVLERGDDDQVDNRERPCDEHQQRQAQPRADAL